MVNDWKEPTQLVYWDETPDWRVWERSKLPVETGKVKVEVRPGLFKRVERIPRVGSSIEEANCLRVIERPFYSQREEERFYLFRRREDDGNLGIYKDVSYLRENHPERVDVISLLEEKRAIIESIAPGAVDLFYDYGWWVKYTGHSEKVSSFDPQLEELEGRLEAARESYIERKGPGLAAFDDWLGEAPF